ncbi:hypothetical protein Tco_0785226 [Tanacetum coccineum]
MSQPANDDFSQHLSDGEESNHEDASDTGAAPKPQQQMVPQTTAISNIKLPILKKEEYDIWAMEMEHYLEYIDNEVWKVIQNGNSKKRISTGKDGVVRVLSPVSAAEIQAVEKERKAKNILLMAIPKEHMRRFHGMDDAKEIWEAIRTRFGGNANSKKMQKVVFKQQFEAFKISNYEGLEKGYDRFQQLLSQLEAHGAKVSTEDANHKVFEQEIQGAPKQSLSAQNVAFVSQRKSSTNKVKSGFSSAFTPSTSSINVPEKEVLAGFADEVIYSLFAVLRAHAFVSYKISEALEDESFVDAMQKDFLQFEIQRLGLSRFALWKKAIIVYQMDVKSAFLYGKIDEEVYVFKPPEEIQMSSMGELTFFLGLQVKQRKDGIFISQDKFQEDYFCNAKSQTFATFTTEAEYVAAASCCGQVLWIQNQMLDYGFNFMNTKIYIDNESTICIVKNPVYHYKTKHIAIRHHFIRDAYEKKLIQVLKIHTDDNVADLLTKAFDVSSTPVTYIVLSLVGQSLLNLFKPISIAQFRTHSLSKLHSHLQALISTFTTLSISSKIAVLDSCLKHNMVAYLEKSEGNEEFHDIIDFLKRSSIHFALTVSPIVSTTFVEQFWTSAKSKTINNVRHITAKVAGKSVSISEASIRSDLRFDDADGIDTLPNQAIFNAIQQMGYEGDLTVLTFNKALFSPQWRFLFHTINHCLSSKSTSWDQIPTNIATAVICLTSNQKYNFSKLIFDGMLRHLDAKKKFVMYPRFISIFLGKQLVDVSVPLDHFPVNTLTSKVFSFMVKKGKHFSGKVTPLFASMLVQPTQDEGASSERPSEALPTPSPAPTSEVPYEPQTDSSLAQTSEVPFEHQPNPSPRPSPTNTIFASIPETSGNNLGGYSSSDKSLSGNEGDMDIHGLKSLKLKKQAKPVIKHHKAYLKSVSLKQRFPRKSFSKKHRVHKEYVSKQGRKFAKGESSVQRDPLFDEIPEDKIDHMETENAQSEGRTREMVDEDKEIDEARLSTEDEVSTVKEGVSTDFEKLSTDRPIVSTDGSKVSTDMQVEGAEEQVKGTDALKEGTEDQTEEEIATQTSTQTPTSMIFGDDETIAKVLLNMSKAKAVSKEKEKGVELKDVEETDRPRPTSTRSLLTLKPLPKIDPKDKGKKKIEEEDESESESDGIPQAEKKFKQLESDEELARKIQEEWEAEEEKNRIAEEKAANEELIRDFDDMKARIEAYRLLAEKLQEQESEHFILERKTKFLHDTIVKRSDDDFISIGSAEDERLIKRMNEKGVGLSKSEADQGRKQRREVSKGKYPIKEWKTECLGAKPQSDQAEHLEEINLNVVIRSNGQKRYFSTLMTVLSIFDREDLNAVYQLVMEKYQDEMPEGFDRVLWGDLMVLFNPDDKDEFWSSQLDWIIVSWKLHSSSGVHTLVTDTETEEENTMALELIKFVKKILAELESEEHKNWLVHKQTACGKDFSNPFMVDNLPKIVRFSTHLASVVKSWLVHDQTVHGKD